MLILGLSVRELPHGTATDAGGTSDGIALLRDGLGKKQS